MRRHLAPSDHSAVDALRLIGKCGVRSISGQFLLATAKQTRSRRIVFFGQLAQDRPAPVWMGEQTQATACARQGGVGVTGRT